MDRPLAPGRRIALHREARGLTRAQLAEAVGRNTDWLRSVESGRLAVDRYAMFQALAQALGIGQDDLLGGPLPPDDPDTAPAHLAVPALRHALLRARLPQPPPTEPAPLDELRRRTDESARLRRDAAYAELGGLLPGLLDELEGAAVTLGGPGRDIARHLLAEAWHDAALTAKRLGRQDLAAGAADRSRRAAEAVGDPALLAVADLLQAEVCLAAGAADAARALVAAGLDRLDPLLADPRGAPEAWGLHGTLLLVGAVLEAQRGRQAETAAHLAGAAHAAVRAGGRAGARSECSAADHALHAVHAALELGGELDVLAPAEAVDLGGLPRERRARHGIDRARARARADDHEGALRELVAADRISPATVRPHGLVPGLVAAAAGRVRTAGLVAGTARLLHVPL